MTDPDASTSGLPRSAGESGTSTPVVQNPVPCQVPVATPLNRTVPA